jgi:hypothetical protein
MGLRFIKRIHIAKGLTLNLTKTGISYSVGVRGAHINIKGDKVTETIGIPNTGISYRKQATISHDDPVVTYPPASKEVSHPFIVIVLCLWAIAVWVLLIR